ncbi:MAG: CopG family transcriptional regulator [Methylobacter sp.]|uniref:CopG family transcriptional regulator n=1 Tax=unclassified Methylobacter TaxID=2635283 RepID=UPI0027318181|nr:CopG family transcriptional regulator [Methylobacter sp.]MDP1663784.1 CopG family transcriptional regulator [Methylobacter sp.]MDP1970148.1 CopG family transcriptional regulator [Methylobacter sp.]
MSTLIKTEIPDQLWQQAQNMVEQGWIDNMDALVAEAMRRYIESHQQTISERFIREDIDWGLHGKD